MHILLLILKIIGIALLVILGLLLLALFLILFVPVRYLVKGEIGEERNVRIHGHIQWLLSIISFRFRYVESELTTELRIFGIKKKKKEDNDVEEDIEDDIKENVEEVEDAVAQCTSEMLGIEKDNATECEKTEADKIIVDRTEIDKTDETTHNKDKKVASKVSEGKSDKRTTQSVFRKIRDIKTIFFDETNQRVVKLVFTELGYLLKHFCFRKIHTNMEFSLADPALTGQVLGVLSLIPALYQYDVHIYPDLESDDMYVKGTFCVAGRIRLVHFIVVLGRLWSHEEIRVIVKQWLKGR